MSSPASNPVPGVSSGAVAEAPANRLPELLAPAGDWECAHAAVENGADAIYFGLEKFNARMRAHNFTEADLPRLMAFLHRRGVKGYVTFNTLVFQNELDHAKQYARAMIAAGVDAAIVQDVGICRLLRQLSPDFPIHASTQMTVTSVGGVEFARDLECNLVVLARECSLKEIGKILGEPEERGSMPSAAGMTKPTNVELWERVNGTRATEPAGRLLPVEVFIHGALCVAYSGQCLTSEALGGRSANRGECAQACRMPYDLIADGKPVALGDRKYLLSPQDLAGLEVLPELVRLGVASLKIEGRLKSPEYVANITRIYRQALDRIGDSYQGVDSQATRASEHRTLLNLNPNSSSDSHPPQIEDNSSYEMEMAFSRGLYTGWFRGSNNQKLVHGRFGKKRGVFLGIVAEVGADRVVVQLEGPLKPGDGIVFDAGKPEELEEGGRVYEVGNASHGLNKLNGLNELNGEQNRGGQVVLTFGQGDINYRRVQVGDKVWKTSDPELERRLRRSFGGDTPRFQRPITIEVHGLSGKQLTLIARDEAGHVARVESAMALAPADKQPLNSERLREQLGRLGGTPFKLEALDNRLEGKVHLPVSELNRLRRQLVADLEAQRSRPLRWTLNPGAQDSERRTQAAAAPNLRAHGDADLIVLVRNLQQFETVLRQGIQTLYCEFEDPKKYREAVEQFRSFHAKPVTGQATDPAIWVAPPRIFKAGEEWTLKQVRSCNADGYLVRNYDHLSFFAADRKIGDYSLNVANAPGADHFKNKFGLERLTASYDLNFGQLEALLQAAPPEWFEVTIHQHMPMFHMEHCVFCAFLSSGTDYTNCGRPCDRHDLKLRDRVGAEHPVKADVGCRNTVFNALAQTGAEYVTRFLSLGVRHFRLEFLNESPKQVEQTIHKYRQLFRGELTGSQLWRELKLFNQLGVTRGQMAGVERSEARIPKSYAGSAIKS